MSPAVICVVVYGASWLGSVLYLARSGGDWTFPLVSLGIFGIALTGLAWPLTSGARGEPVAVARPRLEAGALALYLLIYATTFLGWGMSAARAVAPAGPVQELVVMSVKLLVHVALPCALLVLLGARLRPLFLGRIKPAVFWRTLLGLGGILIALLCVVSPSLSEIAALDVDAFTLTWAAPAAFAWIAIEAGLNEEFLFRAVLQSRLAALLRSELAAVLIGALAFALAHAPGLYLRGGPEVDGWSADPLQVAAYTVATLSPLALLLGLVWARTRCLLLVVLLHTCVDILPGLPEFVSIWRG